MKRTGGAAGLLAGQVALVTGAAGGIGRGIALSLARAGAAVAVHHRTSAAGEVLAAVRETGAEAVALRADLTDDDACRRLVLDAADWAASLRDPQDPTKSRRLTALVNNAGVQPTQALPGMSLADWKAVVDTNLSSVFSCTQAAAEVMMRGTGSDTGSDAGSDIDARVRGGTITHIASIEAARPAPLHAHYSAAKAAVVMHARSAALEYGPHGIRVNTVSPGLIDRDGLADAWPDGVRRWREAVPTGRLGRPEDVGDACVFLASPLASWVTGHDLVVDGGVSARPTW
ncbi:SDR family NAD(P)-dependent oxidoreductase [Streptomyces sp. NPDC059786]|uniref:SDR family NAD(P)-dependent oxidoreductase n=1 Tax=Streptomyces sp. NPDC059786 TaxID=3346946 RepID=UPI00364D1A12